MNAILPKKIRRYIVNERTGASHIVELGSYDRIVVAFSGGKDSLACVLWLLDQGVPPHMIELHHHYVDGGGRHFMDWPITRAYCAAVAAFLGLRLYFSGKVGGFEREMLRNNAPTAPTYFDTPEGNVVTIGGNGKPKTREQFPQVGKIEIGRWCSPICKIDVLTRLINNEPRFLTGKTLVVTGERAAESATRENYQLFEPDRTDNRHGVRVARWVDHLRPIHQWSEDQVWAIIREHGICPHPAYCLGWGRLSCRQCIFGSPNQWATIRAVYPAAFKLVADYEKQFGKTIHRTMTVTELADCGTPYAAAMSQLELAAFADQEVWGDRPIWTADWQMPAGAFGESAGPD